MAVTSVLLATDSNDIFRSVDAAVASSELQVSRVAKGQQVVAAVAQIQPDLVILDMQIENMGGFAVSKALRQEQGFDRLVDSKIMLLLDRQADEFLASKSGADAWFVKPLDPVRLQASVAELVNS